MASFNEEHEPWPKDTAKYRRVMANARWLSFESAAPCGPVLCKGLGGAAAPTVAADVLVAQMNQKAARARHATAMHDLLEMNNL